MGSGGANSGKPSERTGAEATNEATAIFESLVHLDESLTLSLRCDRATLLRHLSDRMILRLLAPKQVRGYLEIEQSGSNGVAVTWTDQASGVRGLHNIAVNLVETKVPVDEQKEYRAMIESLSAQQPLEVVTLNLVTVYATWR